MEYPPSGSPANEELIAQTSALFMNQIEGLTTYQMNFIRAVCSGTHAGFGVKDLTLEYDFGAKS